MNRIDEIVRFRALTRDDIGLIVDIQLEHLIVRMAERRITLQVTPAARVSLAEKGYDPSFGARPLKRLIQREIADKAAVLILDGAVTEDGAVRVDVVDGAMTVTAA